MCDKTSIKETNAYVRIISGYVKRYAPNNVRCFSLKYGRLANICYRIRIYVFRPSGTPAVNINILRVQRIYVS